MQKITNWNHPVLLTGCPRTGSTALTRCLSTHRDFCLFNEYHLFLTEGDKYQLWNRIMTMPDANIPPTQVCGSTVELRQFMKQSFPNKADNQMLRSWLLSAAYPQPRIYGDKLPLRYLFEIQSIARRFPEARCLITVRDGRDVIASQLRAYRQSREAGNEIQYWMTSTVQEAQKLWLGAMSRWLEIRDNPPVACLEVRYEDATEAPRMALKHICEFVGIEYQEEAFQQFLASYRPVNVGIWKEEVPNLDQHLSDEFHHCLEQLAYE